LGESFTDGGLKPMIETKPWGKTTVTPIHDSGANYHDTSFDCNLQQGFSQSHTIESKTFVTKVSDVTISSREVF
jgi:hypothetical protein